MNAFVTAVLNVLLPSVCPHCRINDGPLLCAACTQAMPALIAPCPNCALPLTADDCVHCRGKGFAGIKQIICAWRYDGICRDLILASKMREDIAATKSLQRLLPCDDLMNYDAICAIPRSPGRRSGPHLAHSLARYVARHTHTPLRALLRQTRLPAAQHELPSSMRRHNTNGLFAIRTPPAPAKKVLLIDDLITSGHTISAAAQCLKRHTSITRVDVLCIARAL